MVLFRDIKQDDRQRITDQQNAEGLNDFHFDIQTQINKEYGCKHKSSDSWMNNNNVQPPLFLFLVILVLLIRQHIQIVQILGVLGHHHIQSPHGLAIEKAGHAQNKAENQAKNTSK